MLRSYLHVLPRDRAARIRKLLSSRLAKSAGVLAVALTTVMGSTTTAHAAIYWDSIQMVNQASQQCIAAQGDGADTDMDAWTVRGCMYNGTSWIWLQSVQQDAFGDAFVHIMSHTPSGAEMCLASEAFGNEPNGPNSTHVRWEACDSYDGQQTWQMITAAAPQNVGNPAGLKHFINFHNSYNDVCLDGGLSGYPYGEFGVYGFYGACSSTNNWQIWNIYTNQTSGPFRG